MMGTVRVRLVLIAGLTLLTACGGSTATNAPASTTPPLPYPTGTALATVVTATIPTALVGHATNSWQ